jgi:hypothetical protein
MSDILQPDGWEVGEDWFNHGELASLETDVYLQLYRPMLHGLREHRRRLRIRGFGTECITRSRPVDVLWALGERIEPWQAVLIQRELIIPQTGTTPEKRSIQQSMQVTKTVEGSVADMTLRRPELLVRQDDGVVIWSRLANEDNILATAPDVYLDSQRAWFDRLHAVATAADLYEPTLDPSFAGLPAQNI